MSRSLPGGFVSSLATGVLEFSTLVKLTRVDGVIFGFTNSDAPITYSGLTYDPTDGMAATAVSTAIGTGVDNMESTGFLSSSRITEVDIVAGLYDFAKVEVRLYDRTSTTATAPIVSGYLGEITVSDGTFKAEFRSLASRLNMVVGDVTSVNCRRGRVGDAGCKFDLTGTVGGVNARSSRTVAATSGLSVTFASDSAPTDFYKYGVVKFTTGPNAGLSREVKTHTLTTGQAVIELRSAFPFPMAIGHVATLEVGCDRTIATCRTKFANHLNFHGEAFLPGNEKMTTQGRSSG